MIKEKSGVKNWSAYNQKLKKRGSLMVSIDEVSSLKTKLPRFKQGKNTILMFDSSGLKIYER